MALRPSKICLFLALGLGLLSCGKKKNEIPAPPPSSPISTTNPISILPKDTLEEAQATAKSAVVKCVDSVDCHPSVGMLSIATFHESKGWGAGRCTGSLIGSDLVLTNAHCIPYDLRGKTRVSCKDRIWLNFAASGKHQREQFECKDILFVSEDTPDTTVPDYALIELAKPTSRPTIAVSRKGIAQGEKMVIQRVTPFDESNIFGGIQNSIECDPYYSPLFALHYNHPFARTAMVSNCEVYFGNSGSPVLDKKGKARGVLFAFYDKQEVLKNVNLDQVLTPNDIDDLNMVTNLACLKGVSSEDIPSACANNNRPEKEVRDHWNKHLLSQLDRIAHDTISPYPALEGLPVEWEVRQDTKLGVPEAEQLHYPAPKCYLSTPKAQVIHWMRPVWTVKTQVNSKLQMIQKLEMQGMEKATLKLKEGSRKGLWEYQMSAKDFSYKGQFIRCLGPLKKTTE